MKIDPGSGIPIYLQIINEIKLAILSGRYRSGDRIMPVRELALELRINPNTVAKAYKILQDEGVLISRPGGGNFIAEQPSDRLSREREAILTEDLQRLIDKAGQLGIPSDRLTEIFHHLIREEST